MIPRAHARLHGLLLLALAVAGCGDGTTGPDSDPGLDLELLSGASQEAGAGTALAAPIVVRVLDFTGRPVVGAEVRWRVLEGGGFTSEAVTATDSIGHAAVRWTLGEDLGLQLLLAETTRGSLTIRATASLAFVRIAAGGSHTCALSTTSQVYCWGGNARGQLGDGTAVSRSRPMPIATRSRFVEIAAGWTHTCGITSLGPTFCWGDNSVGQLGLGGPGPFQADPVAVRNIDPLVRVTAGYIHTCGVSGAGAVLCWGSNESGQLGGSQSPVARAAESGFQAVTAGEFHTCGLRGDGRVDCWGWNTLGELGTDVPLGAVSGPAPVRGTLRFTRVAAGFRHTCAIAVSGEVYCWGRSADGETGQPPNDHTSTPTIVRATSGFTELGTGNAHTCGIAVGRAYCWGAILGNGTSNRTHVPTLVSGTLGFTAIAVGFEHTCGIAGGQVWCWGSNRQGQLGRPDVTFGDAPARVAFN